MFNEKASLAAAVAASIALLLPSIAAAQRGSGAPGGTEPAVGVSAAGRRAPVNGVRVNRSRSRAVASTNNAKRNAEDAFGLGGAFGDIGGVPLSLQDLLNITPTNGFDWQFVNSINQDLGIKAFIDPVTQIRVAEAERFLRNTGGVFGGAYILGGGGYYYPPESEENAQPENEQGPPSESQTAAQAGQPQIIVLQQAPPQQAPPESQVQAPAQEEVPDRGEFTLVLRNGKEIPAVAFTHSKNSIIYITPEGGRLTIAASDLDADATVRVNQERGTPLQSPL